MDLAEVLELVGKREEAVEAVEQALTLYQRKGNLKGRRRSLARFRGRGAPPA